MGMRRIQELQNKDYQDEQLLRLLKDYLDLAEIQNYGNGHLYTYLRQECYSFSRPRLRKALRLLDPDNIRLRWGQVHRRQRNFNSQGPSYLWSVDGHCNLQDFGFEIYAAIDSYSREIIWIYCGVSGLTGISVARPRSRDSATENQI
ncbi:MAG: hypothetical protein Q9182_005749 [Xanthomendoza sp. 2 TL-2023]